MIIGIMGLIGTGKDTTADILIKHHNFKKVSYASTLKDVASDIFGWDREMLEGKSIESRVRRDEVDKWWSSKLGIPNFSPRLALQLLGTYVLRQHFHQDIWVLSLQRKLMQATGNFVFSDVRFPNEIKNIRECGGVIWWVKRGELPEWWDVACLANSGDLSAYKTMKSKYSNVHESEWGWAGTVPDFELSNNLDIERHLVPLVKKRLSDSELVF